MAEYSYLERYGCGLRRSEVAALTFGHRRAVETTEPDWQNWLPNRTFLDAERINADDLRRILAEFDATQPAPHFAPQSIVEILQRALSRYKFKREPIFYCHVAGQKDPWYGDKSQSTTWEEKEACGQPASPDHEASRTHRARPIE